MKIKNKKNALVIGGLLAGTVMVLGGIINCLHSYDFKHCSLIWVGLLLLADERGLCNLEIRGALSATILIGMFSFVIFGWYYNRITGE